ncbi:unnamed protein product, partial [marine sediment metagenome]
MGLFENHAIGMDGKAILVESILNITHSNPGIGRHDSTINRIPAYPSLERAVGLLDDLNHLPDEKKEELRVKLKVSYNGYTYRYIPDKMLRITKGKNSVNFWDIMPFYHSSLDAAAQKYLGKCKLGSNPNLFTPDYVKL